MSERPPISPRVPRGALKPGQVPPPPKRSERARNPCGVIGNAIITILIILMIGAGTVYYYGRQMLETPGPLREDKIVNIPSRAGKRDIADALLREGVINVNPWVFIGGVFALKASSDLKPGEYSFQKNASLRDVIATIFEGKVVQHAVTIPEGLTSEQIVARLVDNDIFAGSVREMPREGTLLSDPTIIYGWVGGKGTLGRPIKRSEITQPSPYNTYVIEGLPPGPIANPGRASLEAAANPARTRDLFFVADGTGGHAFTETYDQHQKNVAKLRTLEKQIQNDTVEPPEDNTAAPAAAGAPADSNPTATTGQPTAPKK